MGQTAKTVRENRTITVDFQDRSTYFQLIHEGFDHGAGHPLLFLDDVKAPNCHKNNGFNGLGNYSEWPKVAGAVIQATISMLNRRISSSLIHPSRFHAISP